MQVPIPTSAKATDRETAEGSNNHFLQRPRKPLKWPLSRSGSRSHTTPDRALLDINQLPPLNPSASECGPGGNIYFSLAPPDPPPSTCHPAGPLSCSFQSQKGYARQGMHPPRDHDWSRARAKAATMAKRLGLELRLGLGLDPGLQQLT